LEIFTEYGRLAFEVNNEKPFQKLMFLIRDWENPHEYSYGLNGGQKLLGKWLVKDDNNNNESKRVRRIIRDYFSAIECFLMPHPGLGVINKRDFDSRIADIDSIFVDYLKTFVEHIFKEENLSVKKIGGCEMKGKQLMEYFQQYANAFVNGKIPEPKTIFRATAEANNLNALITAKESYQSSMDKVCGTKNKFIKQKKLLEHHEKYSNDALTEFDNTKKIGGDEFSSEYRKKLEDLKKMYENYERINSLKKRYVIGTGLGSNSAESRTNLCYFSVKKVAHFWVTGTRDIL
jgi:atlastin